MAKYKATDHLLVNDGSMKEGTEREDVILSPIHHQQLFLLVQVGIQGNIILLDSNALKGVGGNSMCVYCVIPSYGDIHSHFMK